MQSNNIQSKDSAALPHSAERSDAAKREEAILEFWEKNGIFKKALNKDAPKGEYVFFEGPPTANAKPALHHLEARAFKDVIPRYKTMQGFHVPRRAGWDTHGLPVELQIEKKLELKSKKEIEEYGIAAFNRACKESVFTYIREWETFTDRIGYWVDKENAYYTFNTNYIESLWNIVGKVEEQGLLYKDYKVIPWCYRCGTSLSSHELAQGYEDDKDLSVTAKFKVKGQDNTYILAWTTTPWTLPGNVALAVGEDITYVYAKTGGETLILAKERMSILEGEYNVTKEVTGKELVGFEYEPLYPYLTEVITGPEKEKMMNAYKVYAADFVTTTDGTGVVHTAVMYGADDFELGTKIGLPKFHTVNVEGKFIAGCGFLEGRVVKDEDVAIDIIKDLAHRGLLFKKEKYEHSYPHCWRCKTALIYYARDSWYIGMSKLRDQLVAENNEINWEPSHIQQGRFGEWLRELKDWAISRERYWGTPLPIWMASDGERVIVDSVEKLKSLSKKSGNTYIVMRHGQTHNNLKGLWSCDSEAVDPLTAEGRARVIESAELLKGMGIDYIIASPFSRTKETAEIVAETIGFPVGSITTDIRLGEWNVGSEYDRKPLEEYFKVRNAAADRYMFKTADGESYADVMRRSGEFLYEIDAQYQGKKILIVSHGGTTRGIELVARGFSYDSMYKLTREYRNFDNAEFRTIEFASLPHNENYELDLHKPYIDTVELEKDGKTLTRVKEVMDVWFDSGSMPFAQVHYPFDSAQDKPLPYPADFISEAIDQTRGWFYTLHAVGVLMGKGKAYKNVICLGHLLDKDGKKMSKSIGNIVEPFEQINKFGVDAVRLWMYSVNQPGDSKNYDEKTVMELNRQVFGLLYNVLSFYDLYRDKDIEHEVSKGANVLDMWIATRFDALIGFVATELDNYKVMMPVREIKSFIDDLSTWYLRRSRDAIKDGDREAKATLYRVLKGLAQIMAPFAPFAAEDIWQKLKTESDAESVHLSSWPVPHEVNTELLENMEEVRKICTIGNALRKKAGIPVRQPLSSLTIKTLSLDKKFTDLIEDELNVKAILVDPSIEEEAILDEKLTPELTLEGWYRELVRMIQDMRKEKGLSPEDRITLTIPPQYNEILEKFGDDLKKTVGASDISVEGEEITIE